MYVVTQRGGKDARYGDLVAQERGTATSWLRSVARIEPRGLTSASSYPDFCKFAG